MHTRQLRLLLGEAPLQCLHEVDHIALRLGGGDDLLALDLALDGGDELLFVLVAVLLRRVGLNHGVDEHAPHPHFCV